MLILRDGLRPVVGLVKQVGLYSGANVYLSMGAGWLICMSGFICRGGLTLRVHGLICWGGLVCWGGLTLSVHGLICWGGLVCWGGLICRGELIMQECVHVL